MSTDTVTISPSTAEWLDGLGMGDFQKVMSLERMAWAVRVLRALPDGEGRFPHGKWATIQAIESQLDHAAVERAIEIAGEVAL